MSNGYEAVAERFMTVRDPRIGVATVREWSRALPRGASVLDLGCGHGVPISQALVDEGFAVAGIDASPTLVAAFRARFPAADVDCAAVEASALFRRAFDGAVAWGLLFLLSADAQRRVIRHVGQALAPGGRFLFTAPREAGTWRDALTGRQSVSLGADAYGRALGAEGLVLTGEYDDEGANHYYAAAKA
jgi:SAM-dependent methyltransferase